MLLPLLFDGSESLTYPPLQLVQDAGPVVALSFRTDGPAGLASASTIGSIVLWNLDTRKQQSVIVDAHNGAITSLSFLASNAQLLSAGADNALKLWMLDQPDGSARLLRSRSGHGAPPTRARFHGSDGITILSGGWYPYLNHVPNQNRNHNRRPGPCFSGHQHHLGRIRL